MVPVRVADQNHVLLTFAEFLQGLPWKFFSTHVQVKAVSRLNESGPRPLADIPNMSVEQAVRLDGVTYDQTENS